MIGRAVDLIPTLQVASRHVLRRLRHRDIPGW
jgi:hypothetical protein